MNCADLETLLCDYVDGTLSPEQKAGVEQHLAQCAACAEMARDAAAAVAFVERAADVEPPPELITRILFELPIVRRKAEERREGLLGRLARLVEPVLQPRFAMGMAMTILSFSMLGRFAGINVRQLELSDLDPVKVWEAVDDRAHRAYTRAVKFYESLRLVYEVRSRLRDLTAQEDQAEQEETAPESPSKEDATPGAPGSSGEPGRLPKS